MKKFIILFMLICTNAVAGYNVCYDVDGTNLRVVGSSPIDGCLYFSDQNMNEYIRVKGLYQNVGLKFMKVVDGVIEEMSQEEIDVILQAEEDARQLAIKEALDKFDVSNLEIFTALIQRINVRIPGNPITKAEIIQQIKDNR